MLYIISAYFLTGNQLKIIIINGLHLVLDVVVREGVQHVPKVLKIILNR